MLKIAPGSGLFAASAIAAALLPATAAAEPHRLAEAAKARDLPTLRALLKQRVDVNVPLPDGATALHWASHWDDLDAAALLIRAGARVNAQDDHGVTPLLLASTNRSPAMVRRLLEEGADPRLGRHTGVTPLMMASRTGSVEIVRMLVDRGADVNARETSHQQTSLMWAVSENHTDVIQVLLENGADVGARTPARQTRVAVSGQFAGGECCLPNYVGGFTPLLFAAQQGHVDAARQLLGAGADINDTAADGSSALVIAIDSAPVVSERVARSALAGHRVQETMARFLLERGADPNLRAAGRTALHSAIQRKMPELAALLLARGADPNARLERRLPSLSRDVGLQNGLDVVTIGATPFWLAASLGDVASMRILLAAGADPTLVTNDRTTALMVAAGIDFVDGQDKYGVRTFDQDITHLVARAREAVRLCLELGLDVNATNTSGQTALFGAVYMGSPDIVQLLVDHGARMNTRNKKGQTPWSVAALGEYRAGSFFVKKDAGDRLEKLGADTTLGADGVRDTPTQPGR
jgi:ankyrin repeat protein